jgi:hypothetical protein
MAIPTSAFEASAGIAVMRQNPGTGEWFFVDWVRGSCDFVLDTPGAGTWTYAHWYVVGNAEDTGLSNFTVHAGRGALLATVLKR